MKQRPRDVNQLGKLMVDIAVGDVEDDEPKSGRSRGGVARAVSMAPEQRKRIATKAANARWGRDDATDIAS